MNRQQSRKKVSFLSLLFTSELAYRAVGFPVVNYEQNRGLKHNALVI